MHATQALRGLSDRTINRLIKAIVIILVVGIPLIAALYWYDRNVPSGPSAIERTIAAAEAAVKTDPNNLDARNALAGAYARAGRDSEAIDQYTQVLAAESGNIPALLGRGLTYRHAAQTDLAIADFEQVVKLSKDGEFAATDPTLEHAYYELGVIALGQGRTADAAAALKSALQIDGTDADALYSYGMALIATGDAKTGVRMLGRAVQFVPSGWCEPYAGLVTGYTAIGDAVGVEYAGAMVDFCAGRLAQAAQRLSPLTKGAMGTQALLGLALVSAKEGDNATAARYYQQILATDPNNTSALIGLSQVNRPGANASQPAPSATAGSH